VRQLEARIAGVADGEIAAARGEMARWYREGSLVDLMPRLGAVTPTPRAAEGSAFLRRRGVAVAMASITCEFKVGFTRRRAAQKANPSVG
jgi:hypothetical protein